MSALVSFVLKMMIGAGKKVAANLDSLTCDPDAAQNALLLRLLAQSADTEIGRKYDFSSIENADDFRAKVPLSVYDDYAESIERMMAGEKNVLTTLDIVHFNETSGTLGAPKSIPVTEQHVGCFADINAKYLNYIAAKKLGKGWTRGKALSLSEGTYRILPSGISCGCASALHTARMSQKGKGGFDSAALMYTSPSEARQPVPGTPTRYLHARFALMEKNVTYGNATFSSFLMEIFRYIEAHWEALCDDIEKDTVSVEMPEGVMDTLSAKLVPMPERARELRAIFSQGFDEPFAPKVWPGLRFFTCVAGAGFQPYTDKLKNRYLGPDIDILYLGLTASEGLFSVPIEMNNPNAVFVPNACFLEFIPIVNEERDLSEGTKLFGRAGAWKAL